MARRKTCFFRVSRMRPPEIEDGEMDTVPGIRKRQTLRSLKLDGGKQSFETRVAMQTSDNF